jgi:hypothetical protein
MVETIAVVGSRAIKSREKVEQALENSPWYNDSFDGELVSGGADGVDTSIEYIAQDENVTLRVIEPDWGDWTLGHPAKVRNTEIVKAADAVVAVWNGRSNGTRDTVDKALDRGKPIYIEVFE